MASTTFSGAVTSTAGFVGTLTGNVTGNLTGYRVGVVSSTASTVSAAAGAANVSTITIQLKDGAGTNLAKVQPVMIHSSSAADGLTLAAAASTGYSVASGGLSLNNGAAITTSIRCLTSATGGIVLSLTDTAKTTSYICVSTADGVKISTQLVTGSYG